MWNTLKRIQNKFLFANFQITQLQFAKNLPISAPQTVGNHSSRFRQIHYRLCGNGQCFGRGNSAGKCGFTGRRSGNRQINFALQAALSVSLNKKKVLYISGEESEQQIKLRAVRLTKNLKNEALFLVALTDTNAIVDLIAAKNRRW